MAEMRPWTKTKWLSFDRGQAQMYFVRGQGGLGEGVGTVGDVKHHRVLFIDEGHGARRLQLQCLPSEIARRCRGASKDMRAVDFAGGDGAPGGAIVRQWRLHRVVRGGRCTSRRPDQCRCCARTSPEHSTQNSSWLRRGKSWRLKCVFAVAMLAQAMLGQDQGGQFGFSSVCRIVETSATAAQRNTAHHGEQG